VQSMAKGSIQRLTLVRVTTANISFGCMSGIIEGTDIPVTVKLVHHRRQRLLGGWPRPGDLVGAQHEVHSVYVARTLMRQEELHVQQLMRRCLPYDIAEAYFSIRRPLTRVEGI